jgi:hypothetical protein
VLCRIFLLCAFLCSAVATHAFASRGYDSLGTTSTSVINVTDSDTLTTGVSLGFWAWQKSVGGSSQGMIFSTSTGATAFALRLNGSPTSWIVDFPWSSTNGRWLFTGPGNANAWHHYLITYNGSSTSNIPTVYLDGSPLSVTTTQAPVGTFGGTFSNTTIGNVTGSGALAWDGSISQFSIWKDTVLSANEAMALSKGASPCKIRPASLTLYAPLFGAGSGEPDWGVHHHALTVVGTAFQTDPPVDRSPCGSP